MVKPELTGEWSLKKYEELFTHIPARGHQIQTSEYCEIGKYPVVDQGQQKNVAYTDESDKAIQVPTGGAIVFGDHTRIIKYVDTNFVIGADGVQVLLAQDNYSTLFLYFVLSNFSIPNTGYNRHFKFIKEGTFFVPHIKEQECIAEALSDVDGLIASLEKMIAKKKAIKQGAMQRLLTGKTRLPGFGGEWENYKLGDLGKFIKGSGISKDEANSGTICAVRYGELYTKHNEYIVQYFSNISKSVSQKSVQIFYGDILFAASGETKEEIGKCAAIIDKELAFAGGDILIFRPSCNLDPIFMGTYLNLPQINSQRAEKGQGDAIVHIHADALANIVICIPTFTEQTQIASVIHDMNTEIESLSQKLAKARQLKQGMMQQLLTGKIRLI